MKQAFPQFSANTLRVGFDAKRAFMNRSGLGNYARTLLKNLLQYQDLHCFLYSNRAERNALSEFLYEQERVTIETPASALAKKFSSAWRLWLPAESFSRNEIRIFHGLSNELPFNIRSLGVKSVVTVHDLIFLRYPELYKAIDRSIYTFKTRKACNDADLVIAISEQSSQDLQYFLKVPEKKIRVLYQSCDEVYTRPHTAAYLQDIKERYQLPAQYMLSVGSIEPRKNLLSTVQALALLKHKTEMPLLVIGKATDYKQKVLAYLQSQKMEQRVQFMENVPLADMPGIYQQASLLLYPSTFEGFGIPIIEALYSRVPVISSTGSCFTEAGGPGSLYVQPGNALQVAEAIEEVLGNSSRAEAMRKSGWEYVQRFNGVDTSRQLWQLYQSLL